MTVYYPSMYFPVKHSIQVNKPCISKRRRPTGLQFYLETWMKEELDQENVNQSTLYELNDK